MIMAFLTLVIAIILPPLIFITGRLDKVEGLGLGLGGGNGGWGGGEGGAKREGSKARLASLSSPPPPPHDKTSQRIRLWFASQILWMRKEVSASAAGGKWGPGGGKGRAGGSHARGSLNATMSVRVARVTLPFAHPL